MTRDEPARTVGRPKLDERWPELRGVIEVLVVPTGAADERRRAELIYSMRTLDDILKAIQNTTDIKIRYVFQCVFSLMFTLNVEYPT